VIIQEMVTPVFSGVAFSRNPTTGLDETVVEVVPGRGDALVQDGVTPERWVEKWGGWLVRPVRPTAPELLLKQVAAETRAIAAAWGTPVDLEWVYDGAALYWLQVRAITAGAAVEIYSNRISREVLPGMIKPLVWSVNVPLVNGAWVRLFTELIGPNDIDPNSLARTFYYRAYFNMGTIGDIFAALGMPRDALELLVGIEVPGVTKPSFRPTWDTLAHTPRMVGFVARKWRFDHQVERFLPDAGARFRSFQRSDLDTIEASRLLSEIDRLYLLAQETAYYNIVTPLLLQVQSRLLDASLRRLGVDAARFDPAHGLTALHELNPNTALEQLSHRFRQLPPALQQEIVEQTHDGALTDATDFQLLVEEFLHRFGHFSDSGNDFSAVPWRENRALVLKMVANGFGQGTSAEATLGFTELPLTRAQRTLLGPLYRRVRSYRLYREQVSSLYTFGYGLFRDYFLALGRHLVHRGILTAADDLFFLYLDEVRQIVADGGNGEEAQATVARRRQEMDACRDVTLPSLIYGTAPPPLAAADDTQLAGTPTSRGYYRGPARVIRGLHEFDRLQPGDVLVIPFSDVGWTPLFRKAGAVVAEAGGILSHSSIVAREYGIPAVVSVPNACRIPDGAAVTVDGYSGKILVHKADKE
jgi:pyruvate,water dikinase